MLSLNQLKNAIGRMRSDLETVCRWSIDFIGPKNGWAVGINGYVTRTTDRGKTWQKVKGNFPRTQLFGITSEKGNIIIGGNRTLITSPDGGESFMVPEIDPVPP